MVFTAEIFALLIVFQLKHFLADYPLQGKYMLRKFSPGWEFLLPLASHSGVHALMTFAISLGFDKSVGFSLMLGGLDFVLHFAMDRIKAGPKYLGKYKSLSAKEYMSSTDEEKKWNTYFWYALGLDQAVHHLTHYLIIYLILVGG